MPSVIVLDNIAQEGLDLLEATPSITYEIKIGLDGDDLRETLRNFDGAICRSKPKITAESLEDNKRLKAIVRAGVGTDNIDKPAATRQGIVVMNTPSGNTLSTAEHAFALMLALSRNIAPANQSLVEGRWDRKKFMGAQLADKTLGVVGLGRIGQEVASRARAFKMKVVGYDPFLSADRAAELGIELISTVDDMLPLIDYLTVHTPLTPETKGLINASRIEKLKPGARLINCARGGIYDEQALADGLEAGKIGGVALDVFESEPCTDSPLFGKPGVLCTPHLGASTEEAQTQVAIEGVNLLINHLTTGEIRHAVNVSAVDPKTMASMRGFLDVAYRLGILLSQWNTGQMTSCRLKARGEVAQKDTKLLTAAFCAGLIEHALDDEASIINSEILLRERGLEVVSETQSDQGAFSSSITAEINTDKGALCAGGTLFGNQMPRLFRLQDYRLEAYLDGTLFIFIHSDVPGIIGAVGTVFGKHDVNIGQMSVGRAVKEEAGSEAIGVLNLDAAPPQEAIDEVVALAAVKSAHTVSLPSAGKLPSWLG